MSPGPPSLLTPGVASGGPGTTVKCGNSSGACLVPRKALNLTVKVYYVERTQIESHGRRRCLGAERRSSPPICPRPWRSGHLTFLVTVCDKAAREAHLSLGV